MMYRIGFVAGMFLVSLYLPWWVVCIGLVVGAVVFSWYGEVIFLGFMLDSLYAHTGVYALVFTSSMLAMCIGVWYIKERMRIASVI